MKYIFKIIWVLLLCASAQYPQEERKVLVEVFTNSHCPICPAAHNVIDNYLSGPNGDKISYIFYHMIYPYDDDPLYWQSKEGSDARHSYYNPVPATPQGWFDGVYQGVPSIWTESLNNLVQTDSPLKIVLSGTRSSSGAYVNAEITRTGTINETDLVIHFVVVEDLYFDGRNSISNHKHVMRKMLPSPSGQSISINQNEIINIEQMIVPEAFWDEDSLSFVVFVQSTGFKTVYQSETISYNDLVVSIEDETQAVVPDKFVLEQNYPNPFNPSTKISWQSPVGSHQTLKVYDLLGREVATLVDEYLQPGRYEVLFSAKGGSAAGGDALSLSSGIYFYILRAGAFTQTKKMALTN